MTLIEKLEGLAITLDCTDYPPNAQQANDLRAIIEEYKNAQEPVAWLAYQGTFQMIADTKDKLPKGCRDNAIPLFKIPQASNEEGIDADRYRWLRDNANVGWDIQYENVQIEFPLSCESFDDLDHAIDEAMKADK